MRRKIVIVLLSLGTILGYAHGFRSLRHGGCHRERRQSFEQHVASLCVDAARRGDATQAGAPPPEADHGRHHRGHHHRHGPWGWGRHEEAPSGETTALRDPFAPGPAVAPVATQPPVVVPPAVVAVPAVAPAAAPVVVPVPLDRRPRKVLR